MNHSQWMRVLVLQAALVLSMTLVFAQTPRPEFPQPQWERKDWVSLNGPWQFRFDTEDVGIREGWFREAQSWPQSITVPFAWETKLSGIGVTEFRERAWYQRRFQIPAAWMSQRVLLRFGAVDYRAQVWVNGALAGGHEGGQVPFALDVTALLRQGENVVTVRVEDPPQDRAIPRGKQYWEPKSRGIFYTRTSGIWQPVWLESVGQSYLSSGRFAFDHEGQARFDLRIGEPSGALEAEAVLLWDGKPVARTRANAVADKAMLALAVENPRVWSLANPNLYDVEFTLYRDGQPIDRVKSYVGFRTVEVRNGEFLLNGRKLYLKFVLDQGYWPESTVTPPSDAAMIRDIELSKQMGFNGARKHQKVEDPRFLYWADKMGFLVSGEMANTFPVRYDERSMRLFTREWMEAVERDINHPSLVMWVPLNESWGVPNVGDARQRDYIRSLYYLTKSLDDSRPVIGNDGWEQVETTDLMGLHDYARDGALLTRKYRGLGNQPGSPVPSNGRPALAPQTAYNGSPYFLTEFGGIATILDGQQTADNAWGYAGVEKSQESALARLRSLYEALRELPQFIGICYTQITDVEQEINGLYTEDRKPKFPPEEVKKLNDLLQ
ncbi:MAG: beta galactosidase jelly roll domain-containing protein [Bryobacterales bacterium]|jgi:beta-galactosidase/beta-glucuronidase|nr:beta galactosidase jelly roll domain-containing protein [Bryobacterales bacterium]